MDAFIHVFYNLPLIQPFTDKHTNATMSTWWLCIQYSILIQDYSIFYVPINAYNPIMVII